MKRMPRPARQRSEDDFDTKSARLVAMQGPFVDQSHAQPLRDFYAKLAPQKDEEHVQAIVQSGIPVADLNQLLREKYGCDLDTFRTFKVPSKSNRAAVEKRSTRTALETKSERVSVNG